MAAKALLPTIILGMLIAGGYTLSNGWAKSGDDVSPEQAQTRLEVFHSLDSLIGSKVADSDVDRALQDMQLDPAALQSLRADLSRPASPGMPTAAATPAQADATAPAVQPEAQAKAAPQRVQLVWVRLWDTDAEDGDVVRIDSGGYSRTVRLTKHGDTFAVPVAADGVIRVTGVKDGDGGGITVGLASGMSQAVFPIMSEGQVLGLRVRLD
ncbi:hypothetical protein [Dyella sp. C9]|uniref:hypothetical protein n=1 Tax=Dyella sp. C9 TaxID=2202154 RepID=UPI000DEEFA10|nr:hypothetical protein [Dyella sp. C9]